MATELHTAPLSRKNLLGIAASFGALTALGAAPETPAKPAAVVGAWRLESFDIEESAAARKPRFGPDPVGYLLYTASGRVSAVLSGIHRPTLGAPSGHATSETHCVESVADFLAYAGKYEIRGNHVFHHVEVSVFTNLVGVTLERQFDLDGDTLTIRTLPPEIWGSANVLVWKRA